MKDEILQATDRGLGVFKSFLSGNFKQVGKAFKNPFYIDNNASCYVFLDKETNTYKFKDFGDPLFFGDCFSLVGLINNIDCKTNIGFVEIMNIINNKLQLNLVNTQVIPAVPKIDSKIKVEIITNEFESNEIVEPIIHKNFNDEELKYWQEYGIDQSTLKFYKTISIEKFVGRKKDGKEYSLFSSNKEPIYGYIQNKFIKIYRPKSTIRFLYAGEISKQYIFGLEQLPSRGDILFITGGEKDVMSLYSRGFNAICFNSETANIPKNTLKRLKSRFKHIVLLYDSDKTGIASMKKHAEGLEEFNVKYLVLPLPGTKEVKDISDYFRLGNTKEQLMKLFCEMLDLLYEETMAILKSCEIDFHNPPIKPDPLITINDVTVGSNGNLLCITGTEGSGKTNYLGGLIAGSICNDINDVDTLGTYIQSNSRNKAVIVYDTEQSEDQLYKNMSYIMHRSNLTYPPKYFKSYCLVGMSRKERLQSILQSMDKFYYEHNGIHMVVIDGIADLISGVNDEEQSVELVDELFRLAGIYKTCIVCVLHLSPSGMKLRGHLGSEIQRKAAGILSVEKEENTNISVVKALKVRDGSPLDVPLVQFGWDNELNRHVCLGYKSKEANESRKIEDLSNILKDIYSKKYSYSISDLTIELMNSLNIKERMARNYIKFMKDHQLIEMNPKNSHEFTTKFMPF